MAKTWDGGIKWTEVYHRTGGIAHFTSIFFTDSLNGWACDDRGGIVHSSDGGNTWNTQRSDTAHYPALNSLFFRDKNNGWAVGNSIILHTTNGGVAFVDSRELQPSRFTLSQNFPNPFNPATAINYQLPMDGFVTLKVYDILGREITTLVNDKGSSGTHRVTWNASSFPSGVYFYRVSSISTNGRFENTKQMMLIR
jgi:hypothetical protein